MSDEKQRVEIEKLKAVLKPPEGDFVSPFKNRESMQAIDALLASLHVAGSSRLRLEAVIERMRQIVETAR